MSRIPVSSGPFVEEISELPGGLAEEIATVIRSAYAAGDLLPGLPTAGGAFESAVDVSTAVGAGMRLWIARDSTGAVTGTVRAEDTGDGTWLLRRLATVPSRQGRGTGTQLLHQVDRAAVASGVRSLVAHAVVERGNPVFYAHAGFTVTTHFGTPGRPVSEVVLTRSTGRSVARFPYPFGNEPRPVLPGIVVVWFRQRDGICGVVADGRDSARAATARAMAMVRRRRPALRLQFLGADVWPLGVVDGCPATVRGGRRHLMDRGALPTGRAMFLLRGQSARSSLANPRSVDAALVSLWRMPSSGPAAAALAN